MNGIEIAYRDFTATRFPLPTERQVAALEKRIGLPLPPDYRRFILDYNGGYFTEPDIIPPSDDCPKDCLTFLSGIGASDPSAELASREALSLFEDNHPVQILPIGYTLMGNLLLLVTAPEDRGAILLKKAYSQEYFFLADDIEGFAALLRAPSEDEEP